MSTTPRKPRAARPAPALASLPELLAKLAPILGAGGSPTESAAALSASALSFDPAKILERLGLHDDACRAAIKGAMHACERHNFTAAVALLDAALRAVPRV